ncbi:hypothetical protein GVAV_000339 [Gurleya vavrai]
MVNLMNNIIDEIDDSKFINLFEKSFLSNDKISGRYIYEFLTKDSEFLLDFAYNYLKINTEDINYEPLIFKKAYAFQDIFFFILNQTRYEIFFNSIEIKKDFFIFISWYEHYDSQQNFNQIFSILIKSDVLESRIPFANKSHTLLEFI